MGVGCVVLFIEEIGVFWFFSEGNLEFMVKIFDGLGINGKYWVGFGFLMDVEFIVMVIEVLSFEMKQYCNELGNCYGILDIEVFDDDLIGVGDVCGGFLFLGIFF